MNECTSKHVPFEESWRFGVGSVWNLFSVVLSSVFEDLVIFPCCPNCLIKMQASRLSNMSPYLCQLLVYVRWMWGCNFNLIFCFDLFDGSGFKAFQNWYKVRQHVTRRPNIKRNKWKAISNTSIGSKLSTINDFNFVGGDWLIVWAISVVSKLSMTKSIK